VTEAGTKDPLHVLCIVSGGWQGLPLYLVRGPTAVAGSGSAHAASAAVLAAHQAFATDASLEEMNKQIGKRIKEAAAQLSTMRVWHANASIGKYVKRAADDAAAGKLKLKGVYTATKSK
jgi:hypothetical protein